VHKLAVDFGATGHFDEPVNHIADDPGGGAQFDPFARKDIALNGALDNDLRRFHAAADRSAPADGDDCLGAGKSEHVALDATVQMESALEDQVADDPCALSEQRPDLALTATGFA